MVRLSVNQIVDIQDKFRSDIDTHSSEMIMIQMKTMKKMLNLEARFIIIDESIGEESQHIV
jgi:hypothetical protein